MRSQESFWEETSSLSKEARESQAAKSKLYQESLQIRKGNMSQKLCYLDFISKCLIFVSFFFKPYINIGLFALFIWTLRSDAASQL